MSEFFVNGRKVSAKGAERKPLLWFLRKDLNLAGTKYSCGKGVCGTCTVHVDGAPVRSCVLPVSEVVGSRVTTIEGMSGKLARDLQTAWIEEQAVQCGYCHPGQIMQAAALLAQNAKPSREEIVDHMNGVLCRCGTYQRIINAIERVANGS